MDGSGDRLSASQNTASTLVISFCTLLKILRPFRPTCLQPIKWMALETNFNILPHRIQLLDLYSHSICALRKILRRCRPTCLQRIALDSKKFFLITSWLLHITFVDNIWRPSQAACTWWKTRSGAGAARGRRARDPWT